MRSRIRPGILIPGLVGLLILSGLARSDVVFSNLPADSKVAPGSSFSTELRVASWSNVVGAFSVRLTYDPSVVQVQGISVPPDSLFAGNTFVDESSFASGNTRIVAFQTTDVTPDPAYMTFATVRWTVVGQPGSSSVLGVTLETLVDAQWNSVGSRSWPASATVSTAPQCSWVLTTICDPSEAGTITRTPERDSYDCNEQVLLIANAAAGWEFSGWSGDLGGIHNAALVTMDRDKSVTTSFTLQPINLVPEDGQVAAAGQDLAVQAILALGETFDPTRIVLRVDSSPVYVTPTVEAGPPLTVTWDLAGGVSAGQHTLEAAYTYGSGQVVSDTSQIRTVEGPSPFSAGVYLWSVPYIADGLTARSVFGPNRAVAWNAAALRYESVDATGDYTSTWPGKGFWIAYRQQPITISGWENTNDVMVQLEPGWNIVGVPFLDPVEFSSRRMSVTAGTETLGIEEAGAARWLKDYAWGWSGTRYVFVGVPAYGGIATSSELAPWQSYWLKAARKCILTIHVGASY